MMASREQILVKRIRILLTFFILGLVLSGLTAFALQSEIELAARWLGIPEKTGTEHTGLTRWIATVRNGLQETNANYPFMAYGTDWLAFAHLVLAILFVGPWIDPAGNKWVVKFGMIACVLIFPLALICGAIRGIPWGWQALDCSFGVLGFVPLWFVSKDIRELSARAGVERR